SLIAIIVISLLVEMMIGRNSNKISIPEKKPVYWVDSMEPTIHYPGPGKSRMGMELTPVYADEHENDQSIRISPSVVNNLGVRTALVTQGNFAKKIVTVGYVEPNENKISHIHTY